MRKQIVNRLGAAHIRDTVQQFVAGEIDRHQAMESLQIGKSQLYELRTSYLAAKTAGKGDKWVPGSSGGNHMPQWSEWKGMVIGPWGRLVVGDTLCTTECANGTRAWCCHHLDGTVTLVMNKPEKGCGPKIIFSNNPNVRTPRT